MNPWDVSGTPMSTRFNKYELRCKAFLPNSLVTRPLGQRQHSPSAPFCLVTLPPASQLLIPCAAAVGPKKKTGGARFPTAEENIAISCAAMTGKTWHECPSSARTTQLVAFVARMRGVAPIGRQRHSFRCASGAFGLEG